MPMPPDADKTSGVNEECSVPLHERVVHMHAFSHAHASDRRLQESDLRWTEQSG